MNRIVNKINKFNSLNVVHYTKEKNFQLRPIYIKNSVLNTGYWCKPKGGMWASPVECNFGWKEWCKENEGFENIDEMKAIEMEIDIDKFIIIDNYTDLDKLYWYKAIPPRIEHIDFEKMVSDTRFPYIFSGKFRNLYGWDCETILILNERCIRKWKEVKL